MNAVDELNALLGIGPPKPTLPVTLQRSGYNAIKELGKGSFGKAYLIFHKASKKYYVAKHVNLAQMSQRQRKEARNEIGILQQMKHPNVVRYEESVEQGSDLYIVMEYADGGDLYYNMNKVKASGAMMTEDQVMNLFVQIAMAIKYMHDRKVIHRDIKPQNVFLTKGHVVKLGDFGISTVLLHTMAMAKTLCGTPCYFSPELCKSQPYNNKSDVWALGVLLYEMASLELPFDSPNMARLTEDIVKKTPVRKRVFSDGMWSLIEMMLIKDPLRRPDIDGVLSHPTVVKAMPRIAKLLAAANSGNGNPPSHGPSTSEDDKMMAMWKAKRDREQQQANNNNKVANTPAPQTPTASPISATPALPGIYARHLPPQNNNGTPRAGNNNILPTPPPAPPIVTPAARTPSAAMAPSAPPSSAAAAPSAAAAAPMSAAAIERAKRDEEYRKLREEMAKIDENRRLRMERERQQEAVVDEYLKKREDQLQKQRAAEAAEAEVKRVEALRVMKEREAREQKEAAVARARDIAIAEEKARVAREAALKAKMEADRQQQLMAEREAKERAEMARQATEQEALEERRRLAAEEEEEKRRRRQHAAQYQPEVMMAESPTTTPTAAPKSSDHNNNTNKLDIEVIADETEEAGLEAVIRNMQSLHERSVHLGGGGDDDDEVEDEVGPITDTSTPKRNTKTNRGGGTTVTKLNQTIIDEVDLADAQQQRQPYNSNHTFEDPMGTRINIEELAAVSASPAKRIMHQHQQQLMAAVPSAPPANPAASSSGQLGVAAPTSAATSIRTNLTDDDDEMIQGSCLCGKVEFAGYVSYIYGSFTCQCNVCKRFTGSELGGRWLHLPAVLFPEVVKPSDALRNFPLSINDVVSPSSATAPKCYFCRKCGSSLAMEHPGIDGCIISTAALDKKSTSVLNRNQRTQ